MSDGLRPIAIQSVFDGRRCCGHVYSRGKSGFEALDNNDRSLGLFATAEEAVRVIITTRAP